MSQNFETNAITDGQRTYRLS